MMMMIEEPELAGISPLDVPLYGYFTVLSVHQIVRSVGGKISDKL
jgi:hypothetical protein